MRTLLAAVLLLAIGFTSSQAQCEPQLTTIYPLFGVTTTVSGTIIIRFDATPTCYPIVQTQAHLFGFGTCGVFPETCIGQDFLSPYGIFWDTRDTPNGPNYLFIEASDGYDNARGYTLNVDIQNPAPHPDTQPPQSLIQSPALDGYQIPGGKFATVTIRSLNADNSGTVTRVDLYINEQLFDTSVTPPFDFNWKPQRKGAYRIQLQAYDASGNTGYSQTVDLVK